MRGAHTSLSIYIYLDVYVYIHIWRLLIMIHHGIWQSGNPVKAPAAVLSRSDGWIDAEE